MTSLRERRRRQTACDIQRAALRLCLAHGSAAVTAEAIAAEAGISTRTFFNYYLNKQAAILGPQIRLDADAAAWFVTSRAPLLDDVVTLMAGMIDEAEVQRDLLCQVKRLIEVEPALQPLFKASLDAATQTLLMLLVRRLGTEHQPQAELIAALAAQALSLAVRVWAANETMGRPCISAMMRSQIEQTCARLTPQNCAAEV
ncbi:TetR family transcriptional regulator [Paracoccus sp. NSM]|uniref:TetR family transcriptional regulator n=1 Tax=Paracoccus sp. NSM TaxID=3457784 RepID=UPI0040356BE3